MSAIPGPEGVFSMICMLLSIATLGQESPKLLPFQGKLADGSGSDVSDGQKVIQFKIYDAPVGGRSIWSGEIQNLAVNGGMVNTLLGSKTSLNGVDFNQTIYLEITVDERI